MQSRTPTCHIDKATIHIVSVRVSSSDAEKHQATVLMNTSANGARIVRCEPEIGRAQRGGKALHL